MGSVRVEVEMTESMFGEVNKAELWAVKTEKNSDYFTPTNAILWSHLCLYIYENIPQPLWLGHKSTTSTCCSRHFYHNLELYFLHVEICWFILRNSFSSNFLTHATLISSTENNNSHNTTLSYILSHISLQPFIESTFLYSVTQSWGRKVGKVDSVLIKLL